MTGPRLTAGPSEPLWMWCDRVSSRHFHMVSASHIWYPERGRERRFRAVCGNECSVGVVTGNAEPPGYEPCERCLMADFEAFVVYRCLGPLKRLLYVGKTNDLPARLKGHERWETRSQLWWPLVVEVTAEVFPDKGEAAEAEQLAIRSEHPEFNIMHRTLAVAA
jgi:predicted GIY-YIG superfamily endonuclease